MPINNTKYLNIYIDMEDIEIQKHTNCFNLSVKIIHNIV